MSTSRYFRGVKLEDPSVTACRNEMLTREKRQREAEAARVAVATVVAAKGRRAQASAAVSERARPATAPSLFRALRPGDVIVKPPTTIPTSTTATPLTIPHEPEPVAAIFDRRRIAAERMAAWLRGDGPGAPRPDPGPATAGPAPAAPVTQPAALLPVADIFARRFQRTARED